MTHYLWFQVALALAAYSYLVNQFQVACRKHTGTIKEVVGSGALMEQLTGKYWNILLALLVCLLVAGPIHLTGKTRESGIHWLPLSICLATLAISIFSKLPPDMTQKWIPVSLSRFYIFIRTSYLVIYELFFRGLLLQLALAEFSAGIAISINVVLYTLAHLYSPRSELIASIPLGFLFCWLRLEYGSLLYPVLLHLCIALPFEIRMLLSSTLHSQNNKP